jgi:hypothetical protein
MLKERARIILENGNGIIEKQDIKQQKATFLSLRGGSIIGSSVKAKVPVTAISKQLLSLIAYFIASKITLINCKTETAVISRHKNYKPHVDYDLLESKFQRKQSYTSLLSRTS